MAIMGADVHPECHIHGGSFFGDLRNLHIGAHAFVNRGCYLDLDAPVYLDDDVVIGHRVSIITAHHEMGPHCRRAGAVIGLPVRIERGVWIGANATVLPGTTIGAGAVVASGAVVTNDVPADTVVAGVPARVIRHIEKPDNA